MAALTKSQLQAKLGRLERSLAREKKRNARLVSEAKEALERQTATAEILRVMSSSPSDIQPVFDTIARNASLLCSGQYAVVTRFDGELIHLVAEHNPRPGASAPTARSYPRPPSRELPGARAVLERAVVHIPHAERDAGLSQELIDSIGAHSFLAVPMLREGKPIGSIGISRVEPGPFPESQIELVKLFADQAVVAIENARLFNETEEALKKQTATAEILGVISSTPTDTLPVFEAIVHRATRLCEAVYANVFRYDGEQLHLITSNGWEPELVSVLKTAFPAKPDRSRVAGRVALDRQAVRVEDTRMDPDYDPDLADRLRYRRILGVPLLRSGEVVGVITVRWAEPGRIEPRHEELLKTFAAQAVIAIENVRLFNETKEALEQQTATGDILRVIAESPTDTQPVFDAVCTSAARLCDAYDALIWRVEGEHLAVAGHYGPIPVVDEPLCLARDVPPGRAAIDRRTIHTLDLAAETAEYPVVSAFARRVGFHTAVSVPLIRAEVVIGVITIRRREVRGFSDKQIQLLKLFADQAAIAIENTRLFNETKEALERQTATAEILEVMSRSQSDLQPVFDTIATNAMRLCEGDQGLVFSYDGALVDIVSLKALSPEGEEATRRLFPAPADRGNITGRAILRRSAQSADDVLADREYQLGEAAQVAGWRSVLAVPMLRAGEPIGAITVMRRRPMGFTANQVALLKTFADQAVIAIENVRLFNETKEALEQQTATAEILRVISSTPTDVQPVFDAIVDSALRIFSGTSVGISIAEGDRLHYVALRGNVAQIPRELHVPRSRDSVTGTAVVEGALVNVRDTEAADIPVWARDNARKAGFRGIAAAPMLREGVAIGAIGVFLKEPGGLSEKQCALLKTFADQAVIAIENTRLFKELQERTEALSRSVGQLTALGEVGQAISSTLDVEKVLQTIVSRAVEITGLDAGALYESDEDRRLFNLRASQNIPRELLDMYRDEPVRFGEGTVGATALTHQPVQIADILEGSYQSRARDVLIRSGARALLAVPLLREGRILGALAVIRNQPGEFAPEVVELLRTFATQSAIAIQNARLFREIADKGRQLEEASRHKSHFLASMSHELRTPLNAILGFNEMILGEVYGEVPADMKEPLQDIQTSGKHLLRLINNVLDLAKIEAGRMELALADYSVQDMVESVRATLRPLAESKGLELLAAVAESVPPAYGDCGRLTQCLMNLAGNSLKFTKTGHVSISVEPNGESLAFRVADTGIGIAPDKLGSLFTEFKQTDPTIASEYGGTGLGLSITKRFIEMHGGRIWVESEPGKGSTFIFEIPLRAETGSAA